MRNIASDSSNTCGTDETPEKSRKANLIISAGTLQREETKVVFYVKKGSPFFDSATHRYCLIALMNMSLVLKTGPAFCKIDRSNCRDNTFDLSSCDLKDTKSNHLIPTIDASKDHSSKSYN